MDRGAPEVYKKIGLKGCNLTLNVLLSDLDSYLSEAFINCNNVAFAGGLIECALSINSAVTGSVSGTPVRRSMGGKSS